METSIHGYIDKYGYRCEINIISEEDIVVFDSTPKLSFDLKEHGIKIKRSKYYDYRLHYVLKDGQIFLCGFEAGFPFYRKKAQIFGADPYTYNNGKWNLFDFDDIPVEYSGTLSIGRDFDKKYFPDDYRVTPIPFSPEVYKENGYIKFEKGRVVEKELFSRKGRVVKKQKNENIFPKNSIPKSPCVIEMSDIDFGQPGALFRTYNHSPCAEIFHRNLKEKAGIEAVATFAYGNLKLFPQIQLYVWVKDSEATEQILKNTPYQSCPSDHPLFRTVTECLLDALQEEGNQALEDISELWDKQQLNDANGATQIYVSITLLSYIRCYTEALLGATADAVSQAFAEHFPYYENRECFAFSLENFSAEGGRLWHNHLYLFMTPQDQERAEASGDVEKMRKLAYDIVSEKDIYGYIPYEEYMPQVTNRRMLTSEQIFHIVRG